MPSFALLILSYKELPNSPDLTTGTAYVIVLGVKTIDFEHENNKDPFFNINTEKDLEIAKKLINNDKL